MSKVQRINITLPTSLYKLAMQLVEEGIYSNFSELVRNCLRKEIKRAQPLLEKIKKQKV